MEQELRLEINRIISNLPESKLKPILKYLKVVEKLEKEKVNTADLLDKILAEDTNLLKRLVQSVDC